MAVPKRRISSARRGNRRSHHKPPIIQLVACSNCGTMIKPHHICSSCGCYRGRQMIVAKTS